jgi:hypothetical protein
MHRIDKMERMDRINNKNRIVRMGWDGTAWDRIG